MKSHLFPHRIAAGMTFAGAVAAMSVLPVHAATPAITFPANVSTVHGSLPLFALHRSAAPTAFVSSAIAKTGSLKLENTRLVERDGHGVLQAYVDGVTGDAEIFPDLSAASAAPAAGGFSAQTIAGSIFARADIIPKDATQARLGAVTPVFAAQVQRANDGSTQQQSAPAQLFTYVSAIRYAAGLPVVGSGSHAVVAVGNDGTIRGLVRRWQTAVRAGTVSATTTSGQLVAAIAAQLSPLQNAHTTISVDSVTPAYYDGDAKYVQPVYLFYATLHPAAGGVGTGHVRGYVPVGKLVEPLPVIDHNGGAAPAAPHPAGQLQGNISQITLGQYANRDGTMQDMANAYNSGFDAYPGRYGPPFNRTQWYWAWPYEVESSANSYLNAVQVAYTMPHGDWYENTTYSNYADFWYVNQIGVGGNPGYGAAGGGLLATWIIDSCEVIPSYYDLQYTTGNGGNAFTNWWPVFKGLHRALGFRTEMLLGEDTMNYDIALSMGEGANADSAFFNTVAEFSFPTYPDYHLNNLTVHYDRASIMYDPRNASESIFSVQGQSASGQLTNVWMGN